MPLRHKKNFFVYHNLDFRKLNKTMVCFLPAQEVARHDTFMLLEAKSFFSIQYWLLLLRFTDTEEVEESGFLLHPLGLNLKQTKNRLPLDDSSVFWALTTEFCLWSPLQAELQSESQRIVQPLILQRISACGALCKWNTVQSSAYRRLLFGCSDRSSACVSFCCTEMGSNGEAMWRTNYQVKLRLEFCWMRIPF